MSQLIFFVSMRCPYRRPIGAGLDQQHLGVFRHVSERGITVCARQHLTCRSARFPVPEDAVDQQRKPGGGRSCGQDRPQAGGTRGYCRPAPDPFPSVVRDPVRHGHSVSRAGPHHRVRRSRGRPSAVAGLAFTASQRPKETEHVEEVRLPRRVGTQHKGPWPQWHVDTAKVSPVLQTDSRELHCQDPEN